MSSFFKQRGEGKFHLSARQGGQKLAIVMALCWVASVRPGLASDAEGQAQTRHDPGAPIDPAYTDGAAMTGGKVYDLRKPEDARAFQEDLVNRPRREATRRRWKEQLNPFRISGRLPWSDEQRLFIYAALKWLAYAGWCLVGLGLAGSPGKRVGRAALWGTVRVIMGIVFGATLFYVFLGLKWKPPEQQIWYIGLYLAIYGPVRWVEWSLMAFFMQVPSWRWRAGGIGVSCLADLLQIALFGSLIPMGRFLC